MINKLVYISKTKYSVICSLDYLLVVLLVDPRGVPHDIPTDNGLSCPKKHYIKKRD